MDLSDTLKLTLVGTYNLAEALESVSNTICPRRASQQHRKRIMLITREIKNSSHVLRPKQSSTNKRNKSTTFKNQQTITQTVPIVPDSPGYIIKKKLSCSIKEINERVKMSRAGKRTIGGFISKEAGSPAIVKNLTSLSSVWNEGIKNCRYLNIDEIDEKPQPYVPLTNGKIEDPIILPTFNEFLQAKGAEFVIRKGSEEILYRIEKAMERLAKLKEALDSKLLSLIGNDDKKVRKTKGTRIFNMIQKVEISELESKKTQDLRKILNQYYEMPLVYTQRKRLLSAGSSPMSYNNSFSLQAKENLEESLREFYRSKALENRKLGDILDKISKDRPLSIREKVNLIQEDNEKYKNKNHSIEKFNEFREQVEHKKRIRQFRNFSQGLAYFEILDEFKRIKYEPSDAELLILELWRRVVSSGWVITPKEMEEIISILTDEELALKPVQSLLEKLKLSY